MVGADYINHIWVPDTFFVNEKVAYFHAATQVQYDHSSNYNTGDTAGKPVPQNNSSRRNFEKYETNSESNLPNGPFILSHGQSIVHTRD